MRVSCPVCADPRAFPLGWHGDEPPPGCPNDPTWPDCTAVKAITDCPYQMGKARQRAEWMKAAPEEFNEDGSLKPGRIGYVLKKWNAAYPGRSLII